MSNLYLRKAVLSDIDLYYDWANDPVVRINSFNSEHIPYEDHVNWFNQAILRDDIVMFVLMEDDIPIGQIRINITDAAAEISYSISSEFRGKGYGSKIVSLLLDVITNEMPEIKTVIARVKPENTASVRVFEKTGFTRKDTAFELEIKHN